MTNLRIASSTLNRLYVRSGDNGSDTGVDSIDVGTNYKVAMVSNPTKLEVYLDNILVNSSLGDETYDASEESFTLGCSVLGGTTRNLYGHLKNLKVYDIALSSIAITMT